jgi:hypothetical protein
MIVVPTLSIANSRKRVTQLFFDRAYNISLRQACRWLAGSGTSGPSRSYLGSAEEFKYRRFLDVESLLFSLIFLTCIKCDLQETPS